MATRIGELKARTAVRTEKTAASLVKDLDVAIEFAKACKNPSAVVRAIVAQARLLGLVVDRSEVSVQHRPAPWPTKTIELSEAEWVAKFSTGPGPRPALTDQGKRLEAEKRKLNGNTRPEPIGEDRSESWRPAAGSLTAIPSDVRECQAEIHKREGGLFLICHVVCLKPLPRRSFSGRQKPANKIYSRQKTRPTNQSHFELSYTTSRDNDTAGCIFQSIRMGYKAWVGAVVLPQRD